MNIFEKSKDYFSKQEISAGDIFSEMLSFWIFVLRVENNDVLSLEGTKDGNFKFFSRTKEDFFKFLSYETIPGYWVTYHENDLHKCLGYLKMYKKSFFSLSDIRNLRIEELIFDI